MLYVRVVLEVNLSDVVVAYPPPERLYGLFVVNVCLRSLLRSLPLRVLGPFMFTVDDIFLHVFVGAFARFFLAPSHIVQVTLLVVADIHRWGSRHKSISLYMNV